MLEQNVVARRLPDSELLGVMAVVVLGSFMSIVDSTIVNVAIEALTTSFHTPLATMQWVSTGYLLALATVIPLTGWAADRFGTKRLYLLSICLFTVGSALAGAAWSAESLIAFRVLQGLGGGMIMPAGMTILTRAAGPTRVGRVMNLVGVPMLIGPIAGPVLGGWLIVQASWRWIFYVNVPIGILALVIGTRFLTPDRPEPSQRLDWLGVLMLSPGLAAFVFGLAHCTDDAGLGTTNALLPMFASLLLIGIFVARAFESRWPLIDPRLFGRGAMAASSATTILMAIAFVGMMFLLPLYFQVVRGQSALRTGLLVTPLGIGASITMLIVAPLADRVGSGKIVLVGMIPFLTGVIGLTQLRLDTPFLEIAILELLVGFGAGATQMPIMTAALQTLSRPDVARANTVFNILQRVGGSIGVALLSVVLSRNLGSIGVLAHAAPDAHAARAFGITLWWASGMLMAAGIAALGLPRHIPQREVPQAKMPKA